MNDLFKGKSIIVVVDADEDTFLYIADDEAIEAFYDENPHADRQAMASEVGRDLTDEEKAALPEILGAIGY